VLILLSGRINFSNAGGDVGGGNIHEIGGIIQGMCCIQASLQFVWGVSVTAEWGRGHARVSDVKQYNF
jgi:hypothetical protein